MTVEATATPVATEAKPNGQATATPPAVATPTETPAEQTVPYARFKEINDKLKAIEDDAARKAQERQAEDEKKLAEQQEWQKLADNRKAKVDELTPKAELADKLSALVTEQYVTEIATWPDTVKAMAPNDDASILTKLEWMGKAKPLAAELMADAPIAHGNGRRPPPIAAATVAKNEQAQRTQYSKTAIKRYR